MVAEPERQIYQPQLVDFVACNENLEALFASLEIHSLVHAILSYLITTRPGHPKFGHSNRHLR